jgi:hypothetical protein
LFLDSTTALPPELRGACSGLRPTVGCGFAAPGNTAATARLKGEHIMWGLVGGLITLFIGAAVVYLAIISVDAVINWFRNKSAIVQSDRDNIAFTIKENMENGRYAVYQGVFNRRTETLIDGHKLESDRIDEQVQSMHARQPMVVYE